jgi:hypothetical protein
MSGMEYLRKGIKDGLVINTVYNIMTVKKVRLYLFYLVREGLFAGENFHPEPKLSPCETFYLEPSDLKNIAAKAERDYPEEKMLDMLSAGHKCLGIKHHDEIVAYGWINLQNCNSHLMSFPLKENEAYLYGARTFTAYRGNNLAPYLRHQIYTHLADMGRTTLYSITEFGNIASIKFKKKLGARNLKLGMKITLLNKHRWDFILRNYPDALCLRGEPK